MVSFTKNSIKFKIKRSRMPFAFTFYSFSSAFTFLPQSANQALCAPLVPYWHWLLEIIGFHMVKLIQKIMNFIILPHLEVVWDHDELRSNLCRCSARCSIHLNCDMNKRWRLSSSCWWQHRFHHHLVFQPGKTEKYNTNKKHAQ